MVVAATLDELAAADELTAALELLAAADELAATEELKAAVVFAAVLDDTAELTTEDAHITSMVSKLKQVILGELYISFIFFSFLI